MQEDDYSPFDAPRDERPYDRFGDRLSSAMLPPSAAPYAESDAGSRVSSGAYSVGPVPHGVLEKKEDMSRNARGAARRAKSKNRTLGRYQGVTKAIHEMTSAERDLRLLSSKAAEAFAPSRLDKFLARYGLIKPYFLLIMVLSFSAPIAVLVFEELENDFALYGRYVWRVTTFITLVMTIPMWIAMLQWRPAYPLNASPPPDEDVPTVDIAICTYKEDVGEIVDTIVACQRVEYAEGMLQVYVLDDGHRAEMKEVCRQLSRSDLLRYSLTYVDRPTNEGKKAGNINHWLREYEHESGEFFIILDADMQPFPDMLDILMGHYYGLSPLEQEICAFIQSPQFYRNYNGHRSWCDVYNISEFFFYRVLQPAMSHQGCTVYVGCNALWSRRAIESIGGFIGGYATEDSVTGCQVNRTLVPGTDYRWISKFVMQPVAAGVSPEILPALLEQRLRWYHGLCQMFGHHDGYIFAKGLRPMQRVLFWVCSASYIANILNYFTVLTGTLILLGSISYYAYLGTLGTLAQWAFFAGPAALGATLFVWSFIPGTSLIQFIHTMSTVFLYTPVYMAAILRHYFGVKIKVQTTAVEAGTGVRRWSKFFIVPVVAIGLIVVASIIAIVFLIVSPGEKPVAPIVQIPIWFAFWIFVHYHVLASIFGFHYSEITYYGDEAHGEYSGESVKAHLARHQAILDVDDFSDGDYDDDGMSSSIFTGSSDGSDGEKGTNPLSVQERREIAATLNFHLARRRAIAGTIWSDKYARGKREDTADYEEDFEAEEASFERRFLGSAVERSRAARQRADVSG